MNTVCLELGHIASDCRLFPHGCAHGGCENNGAFHVEIQCRNQTVSKAMCAASNNVGGGGCDDKESAVGCQFDVRTERVTRIESADNRRAIALCRKSCSPYELEGCLTENDRYVETALCQAANERR